MVKLTKIYKNFDIDSSHKNSIVLIGNFDGVHLGHQRLFSLAKKYKKKYSLKSGVMTFEPMTKMYFKKDIKNFRISSQKQKMRLLNKFNVDFVITKKFNRAFSKTKSIHFIEKILVKKLNAKFIFVICTPQRQDWRSPPWQDCELCWPSSYWHLPIGGASRHTFSV